nr:proton-conducting transporter membrane subunit [Candidatus Freyarchaeota archaeon]
MIPYSPWLVWIVPMLGAVLTPVLSKIHPKFRDVCAILFAGAAAVIAISMIPDIWSGFIILPEPQLLIGTSLYPWDISQTLSGTLFGTTVNIPIVIRWMSLVPFDWTYLWIPNIPLNPPAPLGIWMPQGLYAGVLVDPLSVFMANVTACIGFLIMVFSWGYMHGEPDLTRYWFFMNFFIGGMIFLVLADNLIQLFIGWEIVGLCSWGLIGFWHKAREKSPVPDYVTEGEYNAYCGMKAFVTTKVGDVALLIAIVIIFFISGTFNFAMLQQNAAIQFANPMYNLSTNGLGWVSDLAIRGMLPAVAILFFGGPVAKSAQFPLDVWLPEAMAGPTTVSALIHAATMVKAGVYLVARVLPIFFGVPQLLQTLITNPTLYNLYGLTLTPTQWLLLYVAVQSGVQTFFITVASIGAFTAFLTASMGIVAREIKKVLAYSTMSQIGYMMLALGVAGISTITAVGFLASTFHLMAHAIFKALLFLAAGAVLHAVMTKDMFEMGGLRKKMPITYTCFLVGSLSLAGFPGFAGFFSKEAILGTCLDANQLIFFAVAAIVVAMTTFYTFRMVGLTFHGPESKHVRDYEKEKGPVHEAPAVMYVPVSILAGATLVAGWFEPSFRQFFLGPFYTYLENFQPYLLGGLVFSEAPSWLPHEVALLWEYWHYFELTSYSGWISELASAWPSILLSLGLFVLGFIPAWYYYISRRGIPESVTSSRVGGAIWKFLYNRWYIDRLYHIVFVNWFLAGVAWLYKNLEVKVLDGFNYVSAKVTIVVSDKFRKTQTGVAFINVLMIIVGIALLAAIFALW